jgi:WD40 repeat protein
VLHQLKGDLDWIIMKCLEKDRTRRYETANGLAADLKRHLGHEPVAARPPSTAYRFQKAFRRNKLVFAAGGAVSAALLIGMMASTWQAVRATRAQREAMSAQASEAKLRLHAEVAELAARQRAYASDMNVAMDALARSNLGGAQILLNRQRPQSGQKDLRGWEWRYLWQHTRSDALFTLCQQKSEIESLAVSANGQWLAIGLDHRDGLLVWDLNTRQVAAHLAPGEVMVRAAFSPAESLLAFTTVNVLATRQAEYRLRLWKAGTRQLLAEFPLDNVCAGLAFSKDGRTLVTSTGLGHITLWRIPEGIKLASYPSEQEFEMDAATGFAATWDLRLAAYGTTSGELRVVDLHDGKQLWAAAASKGFITALAFSPDGKTLASGAGFNESDIRLWDVATRKPIGLLQGHKGWVGSLVFWPDGKRLASGSADQTIRVWDLSSRKSLDVLRGHRQEVWRLALLPDNETLVSGSKDGEVCVWDTSVPHPRRESIIWPGKLSNWRFTPDSRSVVTLDSEGRIARWSGPSFQEKDLQMEIGTNCTGSSFSPDARFLALGSTNGNISVWDVSRRVLRREFKVSAGPIIPITFLAQGNRLVVRSIASNQFSEWDLEATREIQSWPATLISNGFGLSPDERLGIAVGWEGNVSCRNLPEHSTTNLSLDALEGFGTVAFSPDGELFAITSALGYARVWRTATWLEEATLRSLANGVVSVVFSPDGQRVATGSSDLGDGVKLWDVDTWQELLTLEGAGSQFFLTAFSSDSNAMGSLNKDGFLHIWQAPSWGEIEAKEKAKIQPP